MIVSENSSRVDSRWLRACVLLCAIVVLPFGLAYAQDYEAVGKRLRAAVEAGELNGEQARAMLGTLRKAGGAKKDQDSDRAKDYLAKVKKERGAAIEAGKISEEEAVKKYEGAEKAIKERMATGRGDRGSNRISREDYARAEVELRKALAEGKISGEDARARLRGMRKMMGEQSDRGSKRIIREDLGRAGIRIRKAVAEGKISKDEGRAKMAAMRRMMAEQGDIDVVALRKRLGAAVDAGRITKEEARAKFAEIKKATDAKDKKGIDYKAIGERIKAAVKAGKLTEEEARAKWKAIKKADDD